MGAARLATFQARPAGWAADCDWLAVTAEGPLGSATGRLPRRGSGSGRLSRRGGARPSPRKSDSLLKTSVLERVNGDLAGVLTGGLDGSQTLAHLERANAFVSALAGPGDWYRYHPMLRAMLARERTARKAGRFPAPMCAPRLVRRTRVPRRSPRARGRGEGLGLAGPHTRRSGDPRLLAVDRRNLGLVLDRLPATSADIPPEVYVCAVARCIATSDYQAFESHLARAWQTLDELDPHTRVGARLLLNLASGVQARLDGDPSGLVAHSHDALVEASAHEVDIPAAGAYRGMARLNYGAGLTWTGVQGEARVGLAGALAGTEALGLELIWMFPRGNLPSRCNGRAAQIADGTRAAMRCRRFEVTSEIQLSPALLGLALVVLREEHEEAARRVELD